MIRCINLFEPSKPPASVGIIGGGQLALMLADAAVQMGVQPIALAESRDAPVAQTHHPHCLFGIPDTRVLQSLFSQVRHIAFENEFVDCELLQQSANEFLQGWQGQFYPSLTTLSRLQNKLGQKALLKELGIPHADFLVILPSLPQPHSGLDPAWRLALQNAFQKWNGSCVLKWAKMGYDGKGVLVVSDSPQDWIRAESFLQEAAQRKSPVFAEEKIDFQRELATIGVFSTRREFLAYPLVISEQKNGICSRVYGPATSFGVKSEIEKLAHEMARSIAESIHLFGSFGIEFFEKENGDLIVNEIAPRVHNSGHYTQDACETDQFQNHWRAILGMPLGSIHAAPGFAMLNILGPEHLKSKAPLSVPVADFGLVLHWYGKKEIRPRRKLGHLNGVVQSSSEFHLAMTKLLSELAECERQWVGSEQA